MDELLEELLSCVLHLLGLLDELDLVFESFILLFVLLLMIQCVGAALVLAQLVFTSDHFVQATDLL